MSSSSLKNDMDTKRLFHNLTAWFSTSVSAKHKALWEKYGGKVDDVKNAQFVFSEDIDSYDTRSLFDSEDFLIGCLTVFHAGFIDACMKHQSAHKVPVSKYIMMPPGLPSELQYVTKEATKDSAVDIEVVRKKAKRSENLVSTSSKVATSENTKTSVKDSIIPHVRDLPSASGPLCDFVPGKDGFTVQRNF